jgi:predicted nicotinamide N-methyase
VSGDFLTHTLALPRGPMTVAQPAEVAELPDDGEVKWAPIAPYWAVLWRSGVALAKEVERADLGGQRVVELGCGLGVSSLAAARAGASVLATDAEAEALELVEQNAADNGLDVETEVVDWSDPARLVAQAPFDLVLAADVLYEDDAVEQLAELLPRLGRETWLADPGRRGAAALLERLELSEPPRTSADGIVTIARLRF